MYTSTAKFRVKLLSFTLRKKPKHWFVHSWCTLTGLCSPCSIHESIWTLLSCDIHHLNNGKHGGWPPQAKSEQWLDFREGKKKQLYRPFYPKATIIYSVSIFLCQFNTKPYLVALTVTSCIAKLNSYIGSTGSSGVINQHRLSSVWAIIQLLQAAYERLWQTGGIVDLGRRWCLSTGAACRMWSHWSGFVTRSRSGFACVFPYFPITWEIRDYLPADLA